MTSLLSRAEWISRSANNWGSRPLRATTRVLARFRWLLCALGLAIFFSMGHVAGARQKEQELLKTKAVVAERYELRRPDGTLAASLAAGEGKKVSLSFVDQKGNVRLNVGLVDNGSPGITLMGANGLPKLALGVDPTLDNPAIVLWDDDGEAAITLGIVKGHGPTLAIGSRGRSSVSAGVSTQGAASVKLLDGSGMPRVALTNLDDGPEIVFTDANDHVRARLKVNPDGSPKFALYDRNNKERLIAQTDKEGRPSIRFVDPANNTLKELTADLE